MSLLHRLAAAFVFLVTTCSTVSAQVNIDTEASGTLSGVSVAKPTLAFGASAELTFDLDYVVRISGLMGAPIINCGLRVHNLRGRVALSLMGEYRQIPVTAENSENVSVLHLGFVLQRADPFAARHWARTLTVKCQPGVIARDGGQPFNVASNPGLGRFFCANAAVPSPDLGNRLPDMTGPDWCTEHGGTYVSAEEAREFFRDGVLDNIGTMFGFQPRVVSLGIGLGDVIAAERARLAEIRNEDGQPEEASSTAEPDDQISRMVAQRARKARAEVSRDVDQLAGETKPGNLVSRLAAQRANRQQEDKNEPLAPATEAEVKIETLADTQGNIPVRTIVHEGCPHQGTSQKRGDRAYWFADESGECVLGPYYHEYERAPEPFSEGFAVVRENDSYDYTYIDTEGKTHFGSFREASPFRAGIAVVRKRDGPQDKPYSAINPKGEVLFSYFRIGRFSESGFAGAVAQDKRDGWGIIDREGKPVVPFEYRSAGVGEKDGKTTFFASTDSRRESVRSTGRGCPDTRIITTMVEFNTQGQQIRGPYQREELEKQMLCLYVMPTK
ncbi:MAG: WG repeat-containing protein [Hoeflea sp.]|nr:WG repeat-containing protein [Hoeflea sp.]